MNISDIHKEFNATYVESLIRNIRKNGAISCETLEELAHYKIAHPAEFCRYEEELNVSMGLFYKSTKINSIFNLFCANFALKLNSEFGSGVTPVQANILAGIDRNRIYSFSGPTSMGKSHALMHIIRNAKRDVVVVLPSRALISEYCQKLRTNLPFGCLVLQFVEEINTAYSYKRIYVITPERSNNLYNLSSDAISLIIFDEAQLSEDGMRGCKFDLLVRKSASHFVNAKMVFSHPFVQNPEAQIVKNNLAVYGNSSFCCTYNNVGKVYASYNKTSDKFSYFSPYNERYTKYVTDRDLIKEALCEANGTILLFTSKSRIKERVFLRYLKKYLKFFRYCNDSEALQIIHKIAEFIGDNNSSHPSILVRLMKLGIVYHHGSMPLTVRSLIEEFVNKGYAKLCVATSTLIQGVNMPFSLVWIDACNFSGHGISKSLALKNLIGRAGRSTSCSSYDIGTVLLNEGSLHSFKALFSSPVILSSNSKLDTVNPSDEGYDYIQAALNNNLNLQFDMPQSSVDRYQHDDAVSVVRRLVSLLVKEEPSININTYRLLQQNRRSLICSAFISIFEIHCKRSATEGEKSIIRTMVPIIFSYMEKSSFSYAVSLRLSSCIRAKGFTQKFIPIPNSKLVSPVPLFNRDEQIDFDTLAFDTYDYIDKLFKLYFSNLLLAALSSYHSIMHDSKSEYLIKYFSFGTTEDKAIWLIRYGFTPEDMSWLIECVDDVDSTQIYFNEKVNLLSPERRLAISPFLPGIV